MTREAKEPCLLWSFKDGEWLQLRRWYQGNRKRRREWKEENGPGWTNCHLL